MTLSISFEIPIHFLHIWYFFDNNNIALSFVIKSFIEFDKAAASIICCAIDNRIA